MVELGTVPLSKYCLRITKGTTPTTLGRPFTERGIHFVKSEAITPDGRIDPSSFAFIDSETHQALSRSILQKSDVLFSMAGMHLGKTALVTDSILPANTNQAVGIIRVDQTKADPRFIHYVLSSTLIRSQVHRSVAQSAQPNFNLRDIGDLPIPSLALADQKEIARNLGALDDKIELNRSMSETLEAIARVTFKSWFVDFDPVHSKAEGRQPLGMNAQTAALFPSSFEDSRLGKIPRGWSIRNINELCEIGRGASPRPIHDFMNGEIPWIKIADATASFGPFIYETAEHVTKKGAAKSVRVEPGDLILSNSATCGVPIFVNITGYIHDGWLYFRDLRQISTLHLYLVLKELSNHLVHIADGSVQKNLNRTLVGEQAVVVPSPKLAQMFHSTIAALFERIRTNGSESRTVVALRDALLPKLISGEIRIKDAEKIVGEKV